MSKRKNDLMVTKVPVAPKTLGEIGKKHWGEIIRRLISMRMVSEIDLPVIEMACSMYEAYMASYKLSDRKSAISAYMNIMQQFGSTPKARKQINASITPASASGDETLEKEFDV